MCFTSGARGRVVFLLYNFSVKRKVQGVLCELSVIIEGLLSSCTKFKSNQNVRNCLRYYWC